VGRKVGGRVSPAGSAVRRSRNQKRAMAVPAAFSGAGRMPALRCCSADLEVSTQRPNARRRHSGFGASATVRPYKTGADLPTLSGQVSVGATKASHSPRGRTRVGPQDATVFPLTRLIHLQRLNPHSFNGILCLS